MAIKLIEARMVLALHGHAFHRLTRLIAVQGGARRAARLPARMRPTALEREDKDEPRGAERPFEKLDDRPLGASVGGSAMVTMTSNQTIHRAA